MKRVPIQARTVPAKDPRLDMGEDELEEHVRTLCRDLGVTRVHHRDSRGTTPGWPDDVLIGTRMILREAKRQDGRVSPAQVEMHRLLAAAGVDVAVWRPADLISGRIAREIAAISPRLRGAR